MAPPPMKAARIPLPAPNAAAPQTKQPIRSGPPIGPIVLGSVAVGAVIVIVVTIASIPGIVRSRCIAVAAERGVALTVDSVSLGWGKVELLKVGFKLDGVPQLAGAADAIDVALSGLTPQDATATGLAITIDGKAEDVQNALDAWRTAQAKKTRATAASGPSNKLTFTGARVTWTKAFGETAKLEALNASGDADGGNAVHLASDKVTVTAGKATFGPWRATLERDAQGTRTHVELDPVVRGGPQATYVRDAMGVVSMKVQIKSSPLSHLGVPAKALGIANDPALEGSLDMTEDGAGPASLKTSMLLTKATFGGFPVDAKLDLSASGDGQHGLDVKQGSLTAGPLRATVTGTIGLFADGIRVALAWHTAPIPCAKVAKEIATEQLGDLGTRLGNLVDQAGKAVGIKMTGDALASGLITLDSRNVASSQVTMTTNETCGLALF